MTSQNIPNKILNWYDNNKRDLPWRKKVSRTQKEYFTLVSEFMLQQTQVKTVIPYFENFISKIPDLKSLSRVRDAKLMKCWEGLGYYSRARNLKKSARQIINEFKGQLPKNEDDLKSLPGIGDYTSKAIMAIAFNKKIIPLDGNVERILKRVFYLKKEKEISKENLHQKKIFNPELRNFVLVEVNITTTGDDNIFKVFIGENSDADNLAANFTVTGDGNVVDVNNDATASDVTITLNNASSTASGTINNVARGLTTGQGGIYVDIELSGAGDSAGHSITLGVTGGGNNIKVLQSGVKDNKVDMTMQGDGGDVNISQTD